MQTPYLKSNFLTEASDHNDEDDLYQQPFDSEEVANDNLKTKQHQSTTLPRAYGYTVSKRYSHLIHLSFWYHYH